MPRSPGGRIAILLDRCRDRALGAKSPGWPECNTFGIGVKTVEVLGGGEVLHHRRVEETGVLKPLGWHRTGPFFSSRSRSGSIAVRTVV
jgi:hypothetical protein